MAKVAINGLGRIGRSALKILLETPDLEPVAVNDIAPLDNLAYLLKYDTVYGRYDGEVNAEEGALKMGEHSIRYLSEQDPVQLPWEQLQVELVFECTGIFRTAQDMQKHLDAGADWVVLSAPIKGEGVPTVVHGVNSSEDGAAQMISCASCTTNCITPVVEVLDRRVGIRKALMTTVHAYTSSQGIVDAPSKDWRRGRAGAANFVPTTTGAATATTKAIPHLDGLFDGIAIRGPVPSGSIADMVFLTKEQTSVEEVNQIFREEAASDRYRGVLGASDVPLVSSDIIGDPRASIVDLSMTQVVDGDLVKLLSWYDNEWGYASQMVKEAANLVRRKQAAGEPAG